MAGPFKMKYTDGKKSSPAQMFAKGGSTMPVKGAEMNPQDVIATKIDEKVEEKIDEVINQKTNEGLV